MQLSIKNENQNGVYHAEIGIVSVTGREQEAFDEFGDPIIETGGDFSGSVTRPGQTDTTLTIAAPGSGTQAVATPIVDAYGVITGADITNGGSGYSSPPAITIGGDGANASLTAVLTSGVVTSITVNNGGLGYHVTPVSVSFSLPSAPRRLRQDFPIRQIFDLADYADADARAKLWLDTMQARILAAKTAWLSRQTPLQAENIVTI